jgi:hypothetical protein
MSNNSADGANKQKSLLLGKIGWVGAGVIVALLALVVSLVKPIYKNDQNAERCGTHIVTQSVPEGEKYQLCSDPSHEVGSYRQTIIVTGQSGWRGGGYNQNAYCQDVMRAKEMSIGGTINWSDQHSSESSRKDLLGHAEYNYSCTIQARWDPIYKLARGPECGETKPIVLNEANSCPDDEHQIGVNFSGIKWIGWPWQI